MMNDAKKNRFSLLWRVIRLVTPYRWRFALGLVALAVGALVTLVLPELAGRALAPTGPLSLFSHPWIVASVVLLAFALQGVSFYFRSLLLNGVGQSVVADLRSELYARYLAQPLEYFDTHRTGDLVSRISSDALLLQDTVSIRLSVILRYSLQVTGGVALMLLKSWQLSMAVLALLPILVGTSVALGRRLRKLSRAQQEALGVATHLAEESLYGMRVVKSFNDEEASLLRFRQANDTGLQLGLARAKLSAFFQSFVSFLMNTAIVAVLLLGAYLYDAGSISMGNLTSFLLYGMMVAVSFAFLVSTVAEIQQSLGAAERVFETLDTGHDHTPAFQGKPAPITNGEVRFCNVSFTYPTRGDSRVLRDVSFLCPPRKITAIVGPSGAGKSTIISLIMGFYVPNEGNIEIDGLSTRELDLHDLRRKMAYVPQDVQLFSMSIRDNLKVGDRDATDEALLDVCRKVNLLEFVQSLPHGLATDIGTKGVQLSGGQRQRLAVARALLRKPRVLLLDEATSALDSENESVVHDAFAAMSPPCTTIVIAHRLSTIRHADQILVFDHGEVVQQGRHEELFRAEGLYRELVNRQELLNDMRA